MENLNFSDIVENDVFYIQRIQHIAKRELHTHSFLEMVYVTEGSAIQMLKNETKQITAGDLFVIDLDTPHGYLPDKGGISIINCLFKPEFLDRSFSDVTGFNELAERYFLHCTGRKIAGPASNQIFHDCNALSSVFSDMLSEYECRREGYSEMLRIYLNTIIINIVRSVGTQKNISPVTKSILNCIEQSYASDLSLTEISRESGYTTAYLSDKFKNDMGGIGFKEYLQKTRIEKACRMLIETDLSVLDIGACVGYANQKFFNRVFKRVTHQTPREFRKTSK